jgi:hypothetical protein
MRESAGLDGGGPPDRRAGSAISTPTPKYRERAGDAAGKVGDDRRTALRFLAFFTCLRRGHVWHVSRTRQGRVTCARCRMRKKIP